MAKRIKIGTKSKKTVSPFEQAMKKIVSTPKKAVEAAIEADKKKG